MDRPVLGPRPATRSPANEAARVLRVAVPSPLRRTFDYLPPAGDGAGPPAPGARVRVPFGRATRIGVVLEQAERSHIEPRRLKRVQAVLDPEPLLPRDTLAFLVWAAEYFHHPVGEVVVGTLPGPLKRGRALTPRRETRWRLSARGAETLPAALARAPRQAAVLACLRGHPAGARAEAIAGVGGDWRRALAAIEKKGLVERLEALPDAPPAVPATAAPPANAAQSDAIDAVLGASERFQTFLLDGVTGSGKTEVYLTVIERIVARGRQAILLIPEIGLTPQVVARLRARLGGAMAVLHSGLPEQERVRAWGMARDGSASVVVGTRSAVFVPLARPGLFIVDEEHDPSFKQQEGFRYSARDLAVVRARQHGVPALLGSATPSLESLGNAARGRYRLLTLPSRAHGAPLPETEIVDLRGRPLDGGLSTELVQALARCLAAGEQALLFLNRRGYAPILICHACGWVAECRRCDARLVFHRGAHRLRCHHCGSETAPSPACPDCGARDLLPSGLGTERVVEALAERFPDARIDRVDRDTTRRKGSLEGVLEAIHAGRTDILVGTQMLAKGHHFPNVTLVGILDADGGLFGADFRAAERMAQLLVQVAGRAGRGERRGRVLVQTHHPTHPLLRVLIREGYRRFGEAALEERREAGLPPFTCMALLRAEAPRREQALAFLEQARALAESRDEGPVQVLGPVPAPMERRAGRHRAQLLLHSAERRALHALLGGWLAELETLASARRVRWSLDVDPQEML